MKLRQMVPRLFRPTQGMRTGLETRSAVPKPARAPWVAQDTRGTIWESFVFGQKIFIFNDFQDFRSAH